MRGRVWLLLMLYPVAPGVVGGQTRPEPCTGRPPDPAWLAAGPVYRDCEVDRVARQLGKEPDLRRAFFAELRPSDRCLEASFEFVVTPAGLVDTTTIRLLESNSAAATASIRSSLPELRFEPARREQVAVPQLLLYRRGVTYGALTPGRSKVPFAVGRVTPEELSRGVALGAGGRPVSLSECEEAH